MVTLDADPRVNFYSNLPGTPPYQAPVGAAVEVTFEEVAPGQLIHEWRVVGIMVAWITVIHQIGSASAAYLAGVLRIAFGTYIEAFIGILLIIAAVMVLFIGAGRRGREPEAVATAAL
jgi:hypothetical protein